ncbi:YqkE family protein [Sporosarcina sp. OR05]|uniref:YqkE family protein n=1 Tax=Sporosarcina sp. OR05 TaxID=2969819 RepID=UPI00352A7BA8
MAKRKTTPKVKARPQESDQATLMDALDETLVKRLKATKKELVAEQEAKELELQAQRTRERKEREKNKSFAELLDEYGDSGSKY